MSVKKIKWKHDRIQTIPVRHIWSNIDFFLDDPMSSV